MPATSSATPAQPREEDLPKPTAPASAGTQTRAGTDRDRAAYRQADSGSAAGTQPQAQATEKERLFANPARPANREVAEETGQLLDQAGFEVFKVYFSKTLRLKPSEVKLKTLKKGSRVIGGTVLGRIGKVETGPGSKLAPHLNFSIRPAGRGAPRIDPKPILDGWKLLEASAIYRAAGRNPFVANPGVGQVLLMSKEVLTRRVLANQDIDLYECGRDDIRSGQVDRRVLATLEFLAASGLRPTVTSLKCGHGFFTKSGNVSHHSSGNAVDISAINGTPILGHQGKGEITEVTVRKLLTLQGAMQPAQIISLLEIGGPTHCDGRSCRPHPCRLPAAVRAQRAAGPPGAQAALQQPVGPLRRPPDGHREPGRAHHPVEVLDPGEAPPRSGRRSSHAHLGE